MDDTKTKPDAASLEKREAQLPDGVETTREGPRFIPAADIFETPEYVTVCADMPGVNPESVDVTIEKNTLSIRGNIGPAEIEGMNLIYQEFEVGDFVRNFALSDEVDRDGVQARMSNGVLELTLSKVGPTRKQIEVQAD